MNNFPIDPQNNPSEFIFYVTEDGKTKIDVRLIDETFWLSQKQMAELFQKDIRTINEHIKNIFEEGELIEDSVIRKFRTTASDGKNYNTMFYNLDVIISVGYRVKSHRGTQFRQWATKLLRDYIIKGFVLNDERLKEPGGIDYFDELLERIRDIRASEKRFYLKIKDIYTTSIDYDPKTDVSKEFFATVQNKMHWAIHGHTAAEIIMKRANAEKPNMGLTTWKGSKVRKQDVSVAKNYLQEEELKELNLIVDQYLSFAELQAKRKKPMYMKDWASKLDDFIKLNDRDILKNAGQISAQMAKELAETEYDKFHQQRLEQEVIKADEEFEKEMKKLENLKEKNGETKE